MQLEVTTRLRGAQVSAVVILIVIAIITNYVNVFFVKIGTACWSYRKGKSEFWNFAFGIKIAQRYFRDRFRVVILKLNSKEYVDGVLKSKVNFEFLVNLFVSENDRIH